MKKLLTVFITSVLLLALCGCTDDFQSVDFDNTPGNLLVMSQNLRYKDDYGTAQERAQQFYEQVKVSKPDLVGTQECTAIWRKKINSLLGRYYGTVGVSRNGQYALDGEWNEILYRKDRFELIDSGTFWLSDTPAEPSKYNGSECPRICTWAILYDRFSKTQLLFCNTHLDNKAKVREAQISVVMDFISDYLGIMPVFLTGDFNESASESAMTLASDKLAVSAQVCAVNNSAVDYTFYKYGQSAKEIDYILFDSSDYSAYEYHVWTETMQGMFSDHYGITTKFVKTQR